ncbi:hypothetical protein [Veronia pacifica]|uniref:Lipoprotein n=1 Tax=Veronia pacifica TaxID=1080227 RepID=A0A1C3EPA1_9GAMM|nr:hypothetical protein [Veronia pacifica]ODA35068.1 hypothetical protein A8L45_05155 [Veronia pacifica]
MRKPVFLVSAILILLQGCHGAQPRDQLINHTAAPDSQEVYFEKTEPLSEQEVISRVDEQYEQYDHVGLRMSRPTGQQDYYVDVEDMSKIDDDDGEKIVVLQYTNKKDASDFGYIWFPLSEQNDSIPGRITVNDGKIPDDIDPEDEYFLNPDFYIDPSAPSFTFINNEQDGTINISGQRVDQYGNTSDIAFTFDPSLRILVLQQSLLMRTKERQA